MLSFRLKLFDYTKIKYEATVDDLIDVHERILARSKVARSWQYQGAATTALLGGLIAGVLGFIIVGRTVTTGLIGGAFTALISAIISLTLHRTTVRNRLRNYFREQFGERDSFTYEFEMSEGGIWTKQLSTQNMFEWSHVEEVKETDDAIEFYMYGGSAVFVKRRAFVSPEEQRQFLDIAQGQLNKSRTASHWLHAS